MLLGVIRAGLNVQPGVTARTPQPTPQHEAVLALPERCIMGLYQRVARSRSAPDKECEWLPRTSRRQA